MLKKTVLAVGIAYMISGCAGIARDVEATSGQMETQSKRLQKDVGRVTGIARPAEPVVIENGFYVGGRQSVKIQQERTLPPAFELEMWFDAEVADLREFAEQITRITNMPTSIMPDAFEAWVDQETKKNSINPMQAAGSLPGLPPIPGAANMASPQSGENTVKPIKFTYTKGPLRGLLDMAASRYGVAWRYAKGEIQFYAYDTKTFNIRAVPGSSAIAATVSSSGQGSGGSGQGGSGPGGTNNQSTSVTSDLSVWTAINEAVTAMLSSKGKVVTSPATGTLTVTDTPEVLKRVENYLDAQNAMLSKQVMITVQVLQVQRNDTEDYSIQWDVIYQDLFRRYGLKNTMAAAQGASSLSLGIISANSKWNGTTAIVNALSEQGTVNLETTASVIALNNQPAPIQTGKSFTYVASSSTTVTPDVGATTEITPGSVNSGFAMHVLPSIQSDGTLFLQFSAELSTLRELRQISSGNTLIEAPDVDVKSFLQRVRMRSGETLILSGFEQTDGNVEYSGVGHAKLPLFGGGWKAGRNKDSLVILVTPIIVGD